MNVTATLFGQMLTFVVFVWFIKAYLWEPLTRAMEDRSNKIAEGLAAAEQGVSYQTARLQDYKLANCKTKVRLQDCKLH